MTTVIDHAATAPSGLRPDPDIALSGPPGAGKGTQAKPLATERELAYIATGDLLRAAATHDSPAGRAAARHMHAGELAPDELVLALVVEPIERAPAARGFVFDGFPRTTAQAQALDAELERLGRPPLQAVLIDVPDEMLIARLSGRRICERHGHEYHVDHRPPARPGICDLDGSSLVRRDDDKPTTVRRRLAVHHKLTEPLIGFYDDQGRLRSIDGVGAPAEIRRRLAAAITPAADHARTTSVRRGGRTALED